MSATPNDSPSQAPIQPLHNPALAAQVVVPQASLGNAANQGLGAKALLAKKLANNQPTYISPTDNMMTPCTQKINAARKKHFTKSTKPLQLFASAKSESDQQHSDGEENADLDKTPMWENSTEIDDENPF